MWSSVWLLNRQFGLEKWRGGQNTVHESVTVIVASSKTESKRDTRKVSVRIRYWKTFRLSVKTRSLMRESGDVQTLCKATKSQAGNVYQLVIPHVHPRDQGNKLKITEFARERPKIRRMRQQNGMSSRNEDRDEKRRASVPEPNIFMPPLLNHRMDEQFELSTVKEIVRFGDLADLEQIRRITSNVELHHREDVRRKSQIQRRKLLLFVHDSRGAQNHRDGVARGLLTQDPNEVRNPAIQRERARQMERKEDVEGARE
ncbi:hypothetical protein B0H11DRAFT_1939644 [Mycena galericulata]|nr:hypothetical protein B0H11DRAFT_1939644 [Mycena galericulata]